MPALHIGCSGFNYPHWQGTFYPCGLPQRRWFPYYCEHFTSVELNVTFYRLLKPATFDRWREETPPDFAFSVKGSRFITHIKRLLEPEAALERFFDGALRLGEKLSAVLWQLPPDLTYDMRRLASFLTSLQPYPVRNALEFRHESWLTEDVLGLCRAHSTALCMADWPSFIDAMPLTANFAYIRRHGYGGRYSSCYTAEELAADARRIHTYLESGQDVHIYFNNDSNGHAPKNALELAEMMRA